MKKALMYFILIFAILVLFKYRFSSYTIEYKVNDFIMKYQKMVLYIILMNMLVEDLKKH